VEKKRKKKKEDIPLWGKGYWRLLSFALKGEKRNENKPRQRAGSYAATQPSAAAIRKKGRA